LAAFLQPFHDLMVVLFFAIVIAAQVYRFRHVSNAVERQQTRWVLFGMVAGLGGSILVIASIYFFAPQTLESPVNQLVFYPFIYLCFLVIPLSIGVAIVRAQLYDIDIIIRRTLVYSVLSGLLALIYFGSVVLLQTLVRGLTGQGQNQFVTVLSTLVLAALFTPLRRRVQNSIDRRFYRRKYNAEQVLAAYGETVRNETDLGQLSSELVAVVHKAMQPSQVSLWVSKPEKEIQP
jgi:hypothetical protein